MSKKPKFYNKDGTLTSYALACGYVEQIEGPKYRLQLFMEHAHYHVIRLDYVNGGTIWDTFDGDCLTLARKRFNELKKLENENSNV